MNKTNPYMSQHSLQLQTRVVRNSSGIQFCRVVPVATILVELDATCCDSFVETAAIGATVHVK